MEQHTTRPLLSDSMSSPDSQKKMCLVSSIPLQWLVDKAGLPKPLAARAMPQLLRQMPDNHLLHSADIRARTYSPLLHPAGLLSTGF